MALDYGYAVVVAAEKAANHIEDLEEQLAAANVEIEELKDQWRNHECDRD
jgi:hypothetical protein